MCLLIRKGFKSQVNWLGSENTQAGVMPPRTLVSNFTLCLYELTYIQNYSLEEASKLVQLEILFLKLARKGLIYWVWRCEDSLIRDTAQ